MARKKPVGSLQAPTYPTFADARNLGATVLRTIWQGSGDDGYFEHRFLSNGKPITLEVDPEADVAKVIADNGFVVDGMMNGSVGILEIDLVAGNVAFWEAQQANEVERFAEFLMECKWTGVTALQATLTFGCVPDEEESYLDTDVSVTAVSTTPASKKGAVTALLQGTIGVIKSLEGCDELLLAVARKCGKRVALSVDTATRSFTFSGGGKRVTVKVPAKALTAYKRKIEL